MNALPELVIKLYQGRIQFRQWPDALDVVRPILLAFEAEGATVRVFWYYSLDMQSPRLNCNQLVKARDANWKGEVIAFLDGVSVLLFSPALCSNIQAALPMSLFVIDRN